MEKQNNSQKSERKSSQIDTLVMQIKNELENFRGDLTDTALVYKYKKANILLRELYSIIDTHGSQIEIILRNTIKTNDELITSNSNLKNQNEKLEIRIRETNIFIKWIAEMLNMDVDGIGYDEIKFGIDDFHEALKTYVAQKSA